MEEVIHRTVAFGDMHRRLELSYRRRKKSGEHGVFTRCVPHSEKSHDLAQM